MISVCLFEWTYVHRDKQTNIADTSLNLATIGLVPSYLMTEVGSCHHCCQELLMLPLAHQARGFWLDHRLQQGTQLDIQGK